MSAQHSYKRSQQSYTPERFLEMAAARPRDERWQLIDGEPFSMMNPPTGKHQKIGANLDRRLTPALEANRPELDVLRDIGLQIATRPDFLPVVDLAVVPNGVGDLRYFPEFYLAVEILSPSNTHEHISRKRRYYAEAPFCLYVLIIAQDEVCAEVWSRASAWQGRVFRSADDMIELPEFGFSCRLGDLYIGTPVT